MNIAAEKIRKKGIQLMVETIEQARDGIFWLDEYGKIYMANTAASELLGYTKDELSEMKIYQIDIDVPYTVYTNLWEKVKVEKTNKFEARHKRKDNKIYPVEIVVYYVKIEDMELMCAFFRDVSEKKRTEQSLKDALDELNLLKEKIEEENIYLKQEIKINSEFADIIGESEALKKVLRSVELVAETNSTVLILGETGTGKELIAHAIHNHSNRKKEKFIHINCASLPAGLIESELFGYEKGAFTGASYQKIGRFELAEEGTIFLDELSELPLELQPKLLRVLQENEFERLGGLKTIKTDVRVIAATNRNLEELVENGSFREDLYYRLNVFPITIPPLRERKEDIPLLIKFYIDKYSKRMGKKFEKVKQSSFKYLTNYDWPGNVRELKNIIERATIISRGKTLELEESIVTCLPKINIIPKLADFEKQYIIKVLNLTNWKVSGKNGAAEVLGLKPTTLEAKMKKYEIRRPDK